MPKRPEQQRSGVSKQFWRHISSILTIQKKFSTGKI
jgi:hypothetical protein